MGYCAEARGSNLTLSRESIMLIAVNSVDALLTIVLVVSGLAVEQNPFLYSCFQHGIAVFCLAKMLPSVALVSLAEWYRKFNPQFVTKALRLGTVAYLSTYAIMVTLVNFQ